MLASALTEPTEEASPDTLRVPRVFIPPEARRDREEERPFLAVTVRSEEVRRAEGRRAIAVIWSMAFVALGVLSLLFLWGR